MYDRLLKMKKSDNQRLEEVLGGETEAEERANRILTAKVEALLGNLTAIQKEDKELFDSLPETMKELMADAEQV